MANYAIMRFIKVKAQGCSGIEKHNERKKEKYKSNPDIDSKRTHLNYNLIIPSDTYRNLCQARIDEVGVKRIRKDAVYMVETVITASSDYITSLDLPQQKAFFNWALQFFQDEIGAENIISAVVHMDEKNPHMHLSFVPITEDGRLSAKDIVGNRKKLCQWQDKYFEHMALNYADLERGTPAEVTGKVHIPTSLFKQVERHDKKRQKIIDSISNYSVLSKKAEKQEIINNVNRYLKEHDSLITELKKIGSNNELLEKTISELEEEKKHLNTQVALKKTALENARETLDIIPDEIIEFYRTHPERQKGYAERMKALEEEQKRAAAERYAEEEKSLLGKVKHRQQEIDATYLGGGIYRRNINNSKER